MSNEADLLDKPDFPEPGSPASVGEDRNLFQAPAALEVEQELEDAEAILNGKAPSAADYPEPEIKEAIKAAAEDALDVAMSDLTASMAERDLRNLLYDIQRIAPQHSRLALFAKQSGLASDFNTLASAAKHIEKRLNIIGSFNYLKVK